MKCWDGSNCSVVTAAGKSNWECCKNHSGRQKCPKNYPFMCAKENCTDDNTDYCCDTKINCESTFGGIRTCNGKEKSNFRTFL